MKSAVKTTVEKSSKLVLFLDFDDVICLNSPYGGYDAMLALASGREVRPDDELWSKLFDSSAKKHLQLVHEEFSPTYVLSTSWRWLFERSALEQVLHLGGLSFVVEHLHQDWSTPMLSRKAHRAVEIATWLAQSPSHASSWAILDDMLSGTGFATWNVARREYVVLCQKEVGFQEQEYLQLRRALAKRCVQSGSMH